VVVYQCFRVIAVSVFRVKCLTAELVLTFIFLYHNSTIYLKK